MIAIIKNIVDHERGRVKRTVTPTNVTDFYIGRLSVNNIPRSGIPVREGFLRAHEKRIKEAIELGLIEVKVVDRPSAMAVDTKEMPVAAIQEKVDQMKGDIEAEVETESEQASAPEPEFPDDLEEDGVTPIEQKEEKEPEPPVDFDGDNDDVDAIEPEPPPEPEPVKKEKTPKKKSTRKRRR